MRELPLSLLPEMRKRVVKGEQTQHREPVKKQPPEGARPIYDSLDCYEGEGWAFQYPKPVAGGLTHNAIFKLPNKGKSRYQVGDKLWLQEPYQIQRGHAGNSFGPTGLIGTYLDDGSCLDKPITGAEWDKWIERKFPNRKTSGRFMYKSLARHWFEVTGVKAERVQDISEEDAKAEGIKGGAYETTDNDHEGNPIERFSYIPEFIALWDSCYGGGEFAWDKNPWEFVYTLRKVER